MNVTLHFQSTGTMPGNAAPFRMLGGSMTLGRGDMNDLVLPDPEKVVSTRHCAIEDQDGNLVVIDLSTNGTFLNYGKMALGKTPTPLNNGDILSIGPYELLVDVTRDAAAPLADPLPEEQISSGLADHLGDLVDPLEGNGEDDFLDGLLGGAAAGPASVKRDELGADGLMPPLDDEDDFMRTPLLDDGPAHSSHGSAMSDNIQTPRPATSEIPDDWDIDLDLPGDNEVPDDPFGAEPDPPTAPETVRIPAELPIATPVQPADADAAPVPAPPSAAPSPSDTAAARAFLEALGAGHLNIPDEDLVATMGRLGGVLNTFVAGVRSILMTRQSIKSEFRINQTVISAGANNPLKFSVSVDQAIEAMARPTTKGYLPAADAAREAIDDISAHEVAMMTGMEAALKGVLAELDPAKLSERISKDKSFTSVLTNKKARYWDVFESQYEKISDQAENDFHELFSKAFASAYQDQMQRLKK
ncbi:MAG: type VI secretion system-associated FHA domain protein TagH [Sulfitobacter sp.]